MQGLINQHANLSAKFAAGLFSSIVMHMQKKPDQICD
ncbi:hypothetical protein LRU_01663 [Ligilactobacillus ruminis SPM0211]|uniref:Uncharacterized protein n=1 Tax=Ligilactobacillus ruminis SPM0211 TaxID=1040964 RepID=F7R1T9_9LACO|nr:hypothetical protein LRU_01663 [Ligilactobacillus ruminis SPM0211]